MSEKITETKRSPSRGRKARSLEFVDGAIYTFEGQAFKCRNGTLIPIKSLPTPVEKTRKIELKAGKHYLTRSNVPAKIWYIDDNAGNRCALGMAKKVNRFGRPVGDVWIPVTWDKYGVAQRPHRENYDIISEYKAGNILSGDT
jgi:hypothetical protein